MYTSFLVKRILILSATMSATVDLKKGEPLTSNETSRCLALQSSLPQQTDNPDVYHFNQCSWA